MRAEVSEIPTTTLRKEATGYVVGDRETAVGVWWTGAHARLCHLLSV